MMVYLVHHADALPPSVDAQRPLSGFGRAQADDLAARTATRGVRPDVIWHSGKLRARQTAEAFLRVCNPLAEFSAIRGMQPSDPPAWIRDQVAREARAVMLVGHMPHLPRLFTLLVTGREDPLLEFPQHGMIAIEIAAEGMGKELWRM
jgi:phosphohistidine phosphatase